MCVRLLMVKDMINNKRFLDILEIICIGLIFSFIPYGLFIKDEIIVYLLSIITRLIGIFVVLTLIRRRNFIEDKKNRLIQPWFYIPLLVLCMSNYIVLIFINDIKIFSLNIGMLLLKAGLTIATVILEEVLFRYLLMNNLRKKYSLNRTIIYSALIFGGVHLLNISSFGSIPTVLIQCIYVSFLGLVLGFIYMSSNNIVYSIIFHFLFNFMNDDLFTELFYVEWDFIYFIVNIGVGLLVLIYLILIQKIVVKEKNIYASENMDN